MKGFGKLQSISQRNSCEREVVLLTKKGLPENQERLLFKIPYLWYYLRQWERAMSGKSKCIILPNGMKVQVSILDGQKQKEKEAERPSRMVPQSSESLRKGESRVIAESKQLATLPSGKSEDPSYGIQKKMVAVPDNNSPIQQKKVEVKQMPKSKKHKNIWTRKKDTTLAERIEVGCYMKVPPYGRSFKVISINTGGFFLDIPNKPTYYATYSYAIDHYFIVVPKSHIETLKRESRHPSEIATMLLMHPITESKIVIKASGYNQQDPRHMKKNACSRNFYRTPMGTVVKTFCIGSVF